MRSPVAQAAGSVAAMIKQVLEQIFSGALVLDAAVAATTAPTGGRRRPEPVARTSGESWATKLRRGLCGGGLEALVSVGHLVCGLASGSVVDGLVVGFWEF